MRAAATQAGPTVAEVGGGKDGGVPSSNGDNNGRGSSGAEAYGGQSSSGSSSSRASPGVGSGSRSEGGQQQKLVRQQLLELMGEDDGRDAGFRDD